MVIPEEIMQNRMMPWLMGLINSALDDVEFRRWIGKFKSNLQGDWIDNDPLVTKTVAELDQLTPAGAARLLNSAPTSLKRDPDDQKLQWIVRSLAWRASGATGDEATWAATKQHGQPLLKNGQVIRTPTQGRHWLVQLTENEPHLVRMLSGYVGLTDEQKKLPPKTYLEHARQLRESNKIGPTSRAAQWAGEFGTMPAVVERVYPTVQRDEMARALNAIMTNKHLELAEEYMRHAEQLEREQAEWNAMRRAENMQPYQFRATSQASWALLNQPQPKLGMVESVVLSAERMKLDASEYAALNRAMRAKLIEMSNTLRNLDNPNQGTTQQTPELPRPRPQFQTREITILQPRTPADIAESKRATVDRYKKWVQNRKNAILILQATTDPGRQTPHTFSPLPHAAFEHKLETAIKEALNDPNGIRPVAFVDVDGERFEVTLATPRTTTRVTPHDAPSGTVDALRRAQQRGQPPAKPANDAPTGLLSRPKPPIEQLGALTEATLRAALADARNDSQGLLLRAAEALVSPEPGARWQPEFAKFINAAWDKYKLASQLQRQRPLSNDELNEMALVWLEHTRSEMLEALGITRETMGRDPATLRAGRTDAPDGSWIGIGSMEYELPDTAPTAEQFRESLRLAIVNNRFSAADWRFLLPFILDYAYKSQTAQPAPKTLPVNPNAPAAKPDAPQAGRTEPSIYRNIDFAEVVDEPIELGGQTYTKQIKVAYGDVLAATKEFPLVVGDGDSYAIWVPIQHAQLGRGFMRVPIRPPGYDTADLLNSNQPWRDAAMHRAAKDFVYRELSRADDVAVAFGQPGGTVTDFVRAIGGPARYIGNLWYEKGGQWHSMQQQLLAAQGTNDSGRTEPLARRTRYPIQLDPQDSIVWRALAGPGRSRGLFTPVETGISYREVKLVINGQEIDITS